MSTGTNRTQLGEHNMRAVIHALRRGGPSSQQDVAGATGLSIQAVSVILRGLIGRGFVREVRSESTGRGRPRTIVDLVPQAAHAIGIHLDPALITVVALDLAGHPVEIDRSRDIAADDPAATIATVGRLVAGVHAGLGRAQDGVVGAALAVPGRVDVEAGAIADSVWLPAWNGVPLRDPLQEIVGAPVPLVKDTLAAISGEIWVRGPELLGRSSVFVYFGIGTGLGLAIDGVAVAGETGNAGQIGRLIEVLTGGHDHEVTTAHDPEGLVRTAYQQALLPAAAPAKGDVAGVDDRFRLLCARAAEGDTSSSTLLRTAGHRVHEVASLVASLLDAGIVVLGGPYWPLLESTLLADAQHCMASAAGAGQSGVRVLSSCLGADAGAIGAASTVLEQRFSLASGALSG